MTIEMLRTINDCLDHRNGKDACIWMVANIAFFSQLCLGEILHISYKYSSFDTSRQPLLSDVMLADNCINYTLRLPATKTEPFQGEYVTIPAHSGSVDPTHVIRIHQIVNSIHASTLLASYKLDTS
jgi:hypothetical protein